MRKKKNKVVAWLLLAVMLFSSFSTSAFAMPGDLLADRAMNEVKHAGAMMFWEAWSNGKGAEKYYPAFDKASGRALFCADPGVTASGDEHTFTGYTVTIANGAEDVNKMIKQVQSETKLRKLETTDTTKLDSIMKMMSTLHYYAKTEPDRFGAPTDGSSYNKAAIAAVQGYIWDCIEGTSGLHKISAASQNDRAFVAEAERLLDDILQATKDLYFNNIAEFGVKYTNEGEAFGQQSKMTLGSKSESEGSPIQLKAMGEDLEEYPFYLLTGSDAAASQKNFDLIQYISINGNAPQEFKMKNGVGNTVTCGTFKITRTDNGFKTSVDKEDSTIYTVEFLKTDQPSSAPATDNAGYDTEWAIYAKGPNGAQSFFTAYKQPTQGEQFFMSFQYKSTPDKPTEEPTNPEPPKPVFPGFIFNQHKYDLMGGFDADTCTPVGDTKLDATITLDYDKQYGTSGGSISSTADLYGHGLSETLFPWGKEGNEATVMHEEITEKEYDTGDEDSDPIPYDGKYEWYDTVTINISETGVPEGHHPANESYNHTISYYAVTERFSPYEDWPDISYTVKFDGKTIFSSRNEITATWEDPYDAVGHEEDFINKHWDGYLQIVKEIQSDDIFSEENGSGTSAGGVVPGKDYSKDSKWTIRIVDKTIYNTEDAEDAKAKFEGYEDCPYIKVKEDTTTQGTAIGKFAHCYKVMLDGTGTPADENNPLTLGDFGQIYVSGLPYGTYLITEYKADADRYVKESMFVTVSKDEQVISTDIVNTTKKR